MSHFHTLTIKDIRRETAECVSISFEIPENLKADFEFLPGQYLTLRKEIDGQEVRRSYSICAAPDDGELRVAVKQMEHGKFSGFANTELRIGDELEVMAPLGKFSSRIANTHKKRFLAFAAGSGITPVFGIMKSLLKTNPDAEFTLVYGNKNRSSIIFKEQIEALKNKYMNNLLVYHVFTRETMDTPLFNGRITAEKVSALCESLIPIEQMDEIFICGPEEMILGLRDFFLEEKKIDVHKVHFELFSSPDQPRSVHKEWEQKQQQVDRSKMSQVSVKLDGTSFDFNLAYGGENILDAALQQGADLPYACKGGVCCSCRAKRG